MGNLQKKYYNYVRKNLQETYKYMGKSTFFTYKF